MSMRVLAGPEAIESATRMRQTIEAGLDADVYVQDASTMYLAPLWDQLIAEAYAPDNSWPTFIETLRAKGKARLSIESEISGAEGGGVAARQSARYVAMTSP